MADREIINSREQVTFTSPGTQTIAIAANYIANIMYLDLSASAAARITITIGATIVWDGWVSTTPAPFRFGQNGVGSGIAGDDIVITQTGGASSIIFLGVKQQRAQTADA